MAVGCDGHFHPVNHGVSLASPVAALARASQHRSEWAYQAFLDGSEALSAQLSPESESREAFGGGQRVLAAGPESRARCSPLRGIERRGHTGHGDGRGALNAAAYASVPPLPRLSGA